MAPRWPSSPTGSTADGRKDVFVSSTSTPNPMLASDCGSACIGSPSGDRPVVVPSVSSGGKLVFQSPARFKSPVTGTQVWVGTGSGAPTVASASAAGVDGNADAEYGSIADDGQPRGAPRLCRRDHRPLRQPRGRPHQTDLRPARRARVVAGAYPYTASRGDAPDPHILFTGAAHKLELVTQSPPGAFAVPVAFAAVVIEHAEGERAGLVVRQRIMPNREPFAEALPVLHDPTVTSLTFAYLDEAGAWQDTWDGETQKTLPRAVRLSVSAVSGTRSETLPPLTITLRVLTP
jgi:hypothetical protein